MNASSSSSSSWSSSSHMRRSRLIGLSAILFVLGFGTRATAEPSPSSPSQSPSPAPSTPSSPPGSSTADSAWTARYDAARELLVDGHYRRAESSFVKLATDARTAEQRALASEMARLAAAQAERIEREREAEILASTTSTMGPKRPPPLVRSTDELTLLYASSFVYGAGTGTWFLLQTKPDSALTALLPFAALTAAPIIAVGTIDGVKKFPRGVPHAISAGLLLGAGESVFIVGYQHARADRIRDLDPDSSVRWDPEITSTVLWGGATLGATLGGLLGSSLVTTPGRVSYTTSTTLWAGTLSGFFAGALLNEDERRRERAFFIGGIGYNLGLAGGLFSAGAVSPSVARVRLVDLLGVGGGLVTAGIYLSLASDIDVRAAEGLAALGAGAGLATGWLVTSKMPSERPPSSSASASPSPSTFSLHPTLSPVPSGFTLGVGGAM